MRRASTLSRLRVEAARKLGIGVAVAVACGVTAQPALAVSGDCYSQAGCTDDARSARAFSDSVGVNTKLGFSDTVYWQRWPLIRARLLELGVSHIRDGTYPANYPDAIGPTVAARYNELAAAGITGNLLVGAEQNHGSTTVAQRLHWIKTRVPSFTTSIEGSNEPWEDATAIRDMQCDIYRRAKADPVLSSKPVLGPSGGPPFSESTWYVRVGDLSACLDRGNLHPYPGADPPHRHQSRDLSVAFARAQTTYGAKPQWITETGYWSNTGDANDVSEAASAVYIPRAFMENFRRGVERTQAYELIDLHAGSRRVLDNSGLLRADGSPKPAFTALKNLLQIVKDGTDAAGSLGFAIVCHTNCKAGHPDAWPTQDGPIRHVLLRQSSGAYTLAVWSESKIWDPAARTDTPRPAQGFRLHLHDAPARVEIFDPATGTSPISTVASGAKILDTVAPDGLRLIRITPETAASPAATATIPAAPSPPLLPGAFAPGTGGPSAGAATPGSGPARAPRRRASSCRRGKHRHCTRCRRGKQRQCKVRPRSRSQRRARRCRSKSVRRSQRRSRPPCRSRPRRASRTIPRSRRVPSPPATPSRGVGDSSPPKASRRDGYASRSRALARRR